MTRWLARLSAALLLGVPVLVGSAIAAGGPRASAGDPCFHGVDIPARTDAAETQIKVGPCFFAPTVARVAVGATVTFFNDEVTHLITGANGEWGSRDVEIGPGRTASFTFEEPGIYPYACALHSGMSGAIVVGSVDPAASAAGGAAEDVAPRAGAASSLLEGGNVLAGLAIGGLGIAAVAWLVARRSVALR